MVFIICSCPSSYWLWQVLGRQVDPLFMSYPSAILVAGVHMTASGEFGRAVVLQPADVADGNCHRVGDLGISVGLLIGRYKTVDAGTDWLVSALDATRRSRSFRW